MRTATERLLRAGRLSTLTVAALCACNSSGETQAPSLKSVVDARATATVNAGLVPGMAVAVAKGSQLLYASGYGVATIVNIDPVQQNTVFQIGSLTKQFTAAAILQLQEQGLLHVDDAIWNYFPFISFDAAITIRMLLNHTSGLHEYICTPPYATSWAVVGTAEGPVITEIANMPLDFPPGSAFEYSNSNYFLLGSIIERVSGTSFDQYIDANVLPRAGTVDTYAGRSPFSVSPFATGNIGSSPCQNENNGFIPVNPSASFAAGDMISTATDLVRWDAALTSGMVISANSYQAMTNPSPQSGGSYGFGQKIKDLNGQRLIWHDGLITGYTAFNGFLEGSGIAIAVLTNTDGYDLTTFAENLLSEVCQTAAELQNQC